jgi:hypothetical protein
VSKLLWGAEGMVTVHGLVMGAFQGFLQYLERVHQHATHVLPRN